MKYIKKFNESSKEEEFDIEYIRHCFADIIDEFDIKIEDKSFKEWHGLGITQRGNDDSVDVEEYTEVPCLQISIDLPRINGRIAFGEEKPSEMERQFGLCHSIEDLVKASSDLARILETADVAVKRLSDEFPEYRFSNRFIDDKLKSRVLYKTKSDGEQPKMFITITK
jgi:hypothetical protein